MIDRLLFPTSRWSYPRRQQYRRLSHALAAALGAAVAAPLAALVASAGSISAALVLVLVAVALGFQAWRWLDLAGRSRVGAGSEDEVRRALGILAAQGWRVGHSLRWSGRGDIDSVAIRPGGVAFAIEVKTRRYEQCHLVVVREQAAWLWRFRRRWCRRSVVPVLCVARSRGVYRWEEGVLVVSLDRLVPALRAASYRIESAALPF
jgi:Holliday junction resolvase-like predicted endonuclease